MNDVLSHPAENYARSNTVNRIKCFLSDSSHSCTNINHIEQEFEFIQRSVTTALRLVPSTIAGLCHAGNGVQKVSIVEANE